MERKCRDCKYLMKSSIYPNEYWCSWLGTFRKPKMEECFDGFADKKVDHGERD